MFIFRTDANTKMGQGHLMRCMSIAEALINKGKDVLFVTNSFSTNAILDNHNMKYKYLDENNGYSQEEIILIKDLFEKLEAKLVIVDSYDVNENYFNEISNIIKTAYIDDLNENVYNVKLLLNYNIYAEEFNYSQYKTKGTKLLLGPNYVPLRKEFKSVKHNKINENVENVLIMSGGSDPESAVLNILRNFRFDDVVKYTIVVGQLNINVKEIKEISKLYRNIKVLVNVDNISEIMKKSDIAISASGSTLYELAACGVPTIAYSVADNQLFGIKSFSKKGLVLNAGDCRNNDCFISTIIDLYNELFNNVQMRKNLSQNMVKMLDGNGSDRIAKELINITD